MDDTAKPRGKLTRNIRIKGKQGTEDTLAPSIVSQNMEDDAGFNNPGYSSVRKSHVALKKNFVGDCCIESLGDLDETPYKNNRPNLNDM